jgi:hypothetical protein
VNHGDIIKMSFPFTLSSDMGKETNHTALIQVMREGVE